MTRAERFELMSIVAVAAIGWAVQPRLPLMIPVWVLVLGLSALLLAQSLVRDVTILIRRRSAPKSPGKAAQCFCLESSVGSAGIIVAAILAFLLTTTQVSVGRTGFVLLVGGTLLLGLAIKDLVISWRPFGIRREKDHLNLVVRWKIK